MTKLQMIQASGQFLTAEDLANPACIVKRELKRVEKDCLVDSTGGYFITAFCWPVEAQSQLTAILTERAKLQKAFDDSMGLIYQLNNALIRGEQT